MSYVRCSIVAHHFSAFWNGKQRIWPNWIGLEKVSHGFSFCFGCFGVIELVTKSILIFQIHKSQIDSPRYAGTDYREIKLRRCGHCTIDMELTATHNYNNNNGDVIQLRKSQHHMHKWVRRQSCSIVDRTNFLLFTIRNYRLASLVVFGLWQ